MMKFSNFRFVSKIFLGGGVLAMSKVAPRACLVRTRCGGQSCHTWVQACALSCHVPSMGCKSPLQEHMSTGCKSPLHPLLLKSASSSCCSTFSSNFCVAMAEQLCSNPWRNNFCCLLQGKRWDHPSKTAKKGPKLGVGSSYGKNIPLPGKLSFPYEMIDIHICTYT